MPWTISTYAGFRATGQPSNWRTAMFELMRGVNQRQAAIAETKTIFFKTDGSQAADLGIADILNLPATGEDCFAEQNLVRIRDWILATVTAGNWTESSGRSDVWTVASLETAIGTDLNALPTNITDARFWQAMQDALDRMIYAKRSRALTATGDRTYPDEFIRGNNNQGPSVGPDERAQAAWDYIQSDPLDSFGKPPRVDHMGVLWQCLPQSTNAEAIAYPLTTNISAPTIASFSGTVINIDYLGTIRNEDYTGADWFVSVGSAASQNIGVGVFAGTAVVVEAGADFTIAGSETIEVELDTAMPATVPFDGPGTLGVINVGFIDFELSGILVYFNIASVLTDQA